MTHTVILNPDMDYLRKLLKPKIKQKIESGDSTELFENYGSHYGRSLKMGGRIIYTTSTNKLTFKRTTNLKTLAEASYKDLISVGGGAGSDIEKAQFRQNSNLNLVTQGGIPGIVSADLNETTFSNWRTSVLENPVFTAFNDETGESGYVIF